MGKLHYLCDLGETMNDTREQIDRLQVAVVVYKQLHLRFGVLADGVKHFEHTQLVVVCAVFALQHAQEDVGHEHFHFVLQMVFELLHEHHENLQREACDLRHVRGAVAQQGHTQISAHGVDELVFGAEYGTCVLQDVQDQLQRQHSRMKGKQNFFSNVAHTY